MANIHVFAGLGSDTLYSNATQKQALRDSSYPQGQVLLERCHQIFVHEMLLACPETYWLPLDLDDFKIPKDLLEPKQQYHKHPVIQNATLSLVQLLRYQRRAFSRGNFDCASVEATSGFCVGLLAAVAAATAKDSLQFLNRAAQCFRIALLVGRASELARSKTCTLRGYYPWSVIVNGISVQELEGLVAKHEAAILISAVNGAECLTISGKGSDLKTFIDSALPSQCSTKPTNIFSPYHDRDRLTGSHDQILLKLTAGEIDFPSHDDLLADLISNIDGTIVQPSSSHEKSDLLVQVLDMILFSPTDWTAVQATILSLASYSENLSVWNYGPGYGALNHQKQLPPGFTVRDVSIEHTSEAHAPDDIAIVGVGIDLPGAPDIDTLWQNLMSAMNSCAEIPTDRFHVEDYYAGQSNKPVNEHRSMGTKYGNFLQDPFMFDNQLFGISPREAASVDPQQRVVLQTVYRALEHAGYVADSTPAFARDTFGCFIGNATLDYADNLRNDIDVYYSPGTLRAFLSGRVSYAFKWSGPCVTVDTACSSSLLAIYQAARALIAGDCRAAVAGGVNVITSPDMYLGLDKAHFLSPSGQCKAFDEAADGYCRSDGCATFVLKRLSDALAENDRILGVIKGIEINQSGQAHSITHPHSGTQDRLFRRLMSRTGIHPHDVSVAEAHGTGTQAGDPNELRSIRSVFAESRKTNNPLYVTSIKSNIGHAEAASGAAGLAKLLMMLKHRAIPPQALLNKLNPAIDVLGKDGTMITTEARAWLPQEGRRRIALLNNFGAAGSNAALLLQEHDEPRGRERLPSQESLTYVLGSAARTFELLEQNRKLLLDFLSNQEDDLNIADICYTSTARRGLQKYRLSVTGSSPSDLIANLERAKIVEVNENPKPSVFLFGGQGSQYLGMGRELMDLSVVFRKTVLHCHELLQAWELPSCLDIVESRDSYQDSRDPQVVRSFQTAVFVIEVAMARLLAALDIRPSVVIGHSLGEFAALVVAGVLDLEGALWLVAERARLIVENCELWETSMLAVNMPAGEVRDSLLSLEEFSALNISCENSPYDCVVGGNTDVLKALKDHIASKLNKRCSLLEVPVAYHTVALQPILEELGRAASQVHLSTPVIAIASNALGRLVEPGEDVFTPGYFVDHCYKTVAFDRGIADILSKIEGIVDGMWIEIGPHPTLLPMASPHLSHGNPDMIPTLKKGQHPSKTLSDLLCVAYRSVDSNSKWRSYFEALPSGPRLVDLPPMPMDQRRYCVSLTRETVPPPCASSASQEERLPFSLLHRSLNIDDTSTFETPIRALAKLIQGHVVCSKALCPASVYTEMALAAATLSNATAENELLKLSDIEFVRPLLYSDGSTDTVRIEVSAVNAHNEQKFEFTSFQDSQNSAGNKLHCTGKIKTQSRSKVTEKLRRAEHALARRKARFDGDSCQTFSASVMYNKIFTRVVEYSSDYQAVKKIFLDDAFEEVYAQCELPDTDEQQHYAGQPILLDTMLHVAGFAANLNVDNDIVCIAHHVHSISMVRRQIPARHAFQVHCSNFLSPSKPDCIVADVHAVDQDGIIAVIKGIEFRRSKLEKIRAAFEYASRGTAETISQTPTNAPKVSESPRLQIPDESRSISREPRRASVQTSSDSRDMTPSNATLYSILSETTGVESQDITPRTELSAMGVDSMMVFELEKKLRSVLDPQPTVSEISACNTVLDMENLVSARISAATSPTRPSDAGRGSSEGTPSDGSERITRIDSAFQQTPEGQISPEMIELVRERLGDRKQPEQIQSVDSSSSCLPLYLFAPGAGIALHYTRMGSLQRDVLTVQDPCLLSGLEDDWPSIREAAQHYASMIRNHKTRFFPNRSAIILGGWSFGGIIAFETACLLAGDRSCSVRGVVLIDSPPPFGHTPIAKETIEAAMAFTQKQTSRPRPKSVKDFEDAIAALTIRNNMRRADLLRHYEPSRVNPMPHTILLRSSEGLQIPNAWNLPQNQWLHDRSDVGVSADAWQELLDHKLTVLDIPGDHFHPFEKANVAGTTEKIAEACRLLEQ